MHITPEHAALIAQVFPTLLIALLLEGRYLPPIGSAPWFNLVHFIVRYVAIVGAAASTFACLSVAGTKVASDWTDLIVAGTTWALVCAVALLSANVLGVEGHKVFSAIRKKDPETSSL